MQGANRAYVSVVWAQAKCSKKSCHFCFIQFAIIVDVCDLEAALLLDFQQDIGVACPNTPLNMSELRQ